MPFDTGGGGGGGGSGTAGLGVLLRQTGEKDLGLWLEAPGIDITGHGVGQSSDDATPANGAHVDLPNNGGGPGVNRHAWLRLQFPADITGFAGADSNNITVRLFRNDALTTGASVVWASATGIYLIQLGPTTTFSNVADAITANTDLTVTTSIVGTGDGSDVFSLPAGNASHRDISASGGHDEIPPVVELLAEPNETPPRILVKYDPDVHTTLQGIWDELVVNDQGVKITIPEGTDLTAAPEAVPWDRGISAFSGLAEAASTGTGGITRAQAESLVRGLTKRSALVGGPVWGDSDISGAIARDAEVPGLLSGALTDGTPSDAYTDEFPFLTASGEWRKTDSEALRQALSVDVGPWGDTPGGFIFRAGDYTTSNGQLFRLLRDSTKNLSSGPETNDDFELIGVFAGDWTDRFFKAGSISRHDGSIWQADVDIAQGSGEPGDNGQWSRLSEDPATVVRVAGKSGSPLTFTLTRADGATYDVTIPGAANSVTDVTIANTNLTIHKRDGSSVVHTFITGNTTVVANNSGTGGDLLERLNVDGTDYRVPQPNSDLFFIWWEETSRVDATKVAGRQWALGNGGEGIAFPVPFDCEVVSVGLWTGSRIAAVGATVPELDMVTVIETTVGFEILDNDATVDYSNADATMRTYGGTAIADLEVTLAGGDDKWAYSGEFVPEDGSPISISAGTLLRPVTLNPTQLELDAATTPTAGANLYGSLVLALRRTSDDVPSVPAARPHISSFDLVAGNQSPVAGDIGGNQYAFTYSIAQGNHAGSARIIGFKGDTQPTDSVEVLATLSDLDHGGGTVTIPDNTMLADGEKYRMRIQVFGEGITEPGAATADASHQDIVITAHAAATALYHSGRVVYDASDADAAATLARIADFTGDTATSNELPSRLTINVPDDGNHYQLYIMAQEDATQPANFTSAGLPATASFYNAQEATYSTVTYNVWILRPEYRVTSDDNGDYFGITS